jgi:hypothetical protein
VKLHNDILKKLFKNRRESVITLNYLFEHCALNIEFFANLVSRIECLYDIDRNDKHSEKSAKLDIMIIAQRLSRTESIVSHDGRIVRYETADILHLEAIRVVDDALVKFNRAECSSSQFDHSKLVDSTLNEEDENEGEVSQFFATDDVE